MEKGQSPEGVDMVLPHGSRRGPNREGQAILLGAWGPLHTQGLARAAPGTSPALVGPRVEQRAERPLERGRFLEAEGGQ